MLSRIVIRTVESCTQSRVAFHTLRCEVGVKESGRRVFRREFVNRVGVVRKERGEVPNREWN